MTMISGYRVIDCSNRLGWLAGRLLADLGADVIKVEPSGSSLDDMDWQAYNVNKRLLRLDIEEPAGQIAFHQLVAAADILIETEQPGNARARYFDAEHLRLLNPRLIQVSVTPFGLNGPNADYLASDLEIMAASGVLSLAGEPDDTPLRVSVPQSYCWAGAQAAVGALMALVHRTASGCGQRVDVSAQAAALLAISHAPAFWDMQGVLPTRCGAYFSGRSIMGARFRAFWPCADGYLNFALYGGPAGRRTNRKLTEWMQEKGADLGVLVEYDWNRFDPKLSDQDEVNRMEEPIARFFLSLTKREFLEEASRREMLGYPVSTPADIASDPQLASRNFWQDMKGPEGSLQRHCGSFAVINRDRPPLRHFPGKEVSVTDLLAEITTWERPKEILGESKGVIPQALAGLKVVEFGGYGAGPHIGKMLASFGATVVHVESHQRPDGFRLEYPPFKDGKPGVNRGGCFSFFNDSKYGVTLDLKKPEGKEMARRLVKWGDVVVENMRPGVMDRLGLGYDSVQQINPLAVMISSCNMGQTGPRAKTPGFGSQLSALAGFCGLTGRPDGPPMLLYGPYIDFIASTLGAAAGLAALDRQRRTGQGAWIDLSQYESGLMFIAGALLDHHSTGAIANRMCNDDPAAAPHNAYCCLEGRWLALSCWTDQEFVRLAKALDMSDLTLDARFKNLKGRKENASVLDEAIGRRLRCLNADETALILQDAQVHAYPVNTVADLFRDAQLSCRRVWRQRRHGLIGDQTYFFSAFDLSETPGDVTGAAPLIGADNERVFREFLGLSEETYNTYLSQGVFD